jgi:peptide deformylase
MKECAMAILEIIQPDNPILRQVATPISDFGDSLQTLIDNMYDTLLDAEGVGLAAPQVAEGIRLILVRLRDDEESIEEFGEEAGKLYIVANPQIIKHSQNKVSGVEGCLSLPGLLGDVDRYESVTVEGQDRDGKPIRITAKDWLARVFQHEIDHLDSQLFIDIADKVWRDIDEEDEEQGEELEESSEV